MEKGNAFRKLLRQFWVSALRVNNKGLTGFHV